MLWIGHCWLFGFVGRDEFGGVDCLGLHCCVEVGTS